MLIRVIEFGPDVVVSANMPLDILNTIVKQASVRGIATVFWMQDIYSAALSSILRGKYGFIGRLIGGYYQHIEARVLEASDRVVVISPDFRAAVTALAPGVSDRIELVQNWAPLDEVVPRPKINPWSTTRGIAGQKVVLYSGTLGHKHDPRLLLETAESLNRRGDVRVVVVSEGPGPEWLASEARARDLSNLMIFPFQPFDALPDVLGSADVVVAMLESDAGVSRFLQKSCRICAPENRSSCWLPRITYPQRSSAIRIQVSVMSRRSARHSRTVLYGCSKMTCWLTNWAAMAASMPK